MAILKCDRTLLRAIMERKSYWVRVKIHREDLAMKVAEKIAETLRLAVQVVPVDEGD